MCIEYLSVHGENSTKVLEHMYNVLYAELSVAEERNHTWCLSLSSILENFESVTSCTLWHTVSR